MCPPPLHPLAFGHTPRISYIMAEKLHPCCNPNSSSPIWEGTSTGKIITIDGIETYIAHPRKTDDHISSADKQYGKRVLLHLTEGHSIYFINAQLLADSFA